MGKADAVEVVTLGECMALVFPTQAVGLADSQALRLDIAGAESNLCIALSRLGHRASFISRVGDDPFGRRIRAVLEAEGVDTRALQTDPTAPTGVFFREHLPDGQRRVYYYRRASAASCLAPDDLPPELFAGARVVHLSGITPALSSSCAAACGRAVELARQAGAAVSFDPNYRAPLWSGAEARAAILPLMAQADILLLGHEDAAAVLGTRGEEAALQAAVDLGPRWVVLKRGARGALAYADGRRVEMPAYPVERVIDPVGAGDGFDAGFLAGWLRGDDLEDCLRLGARVGAAAVGVMGDYAGYPRAGTESRPAAGG
jgi:2-dehydro-3-deoxygluconokinase